MIRFEEEWEDENGAGQKIAGWGQSDKLIIGLAPGSFFELEENQKIKIGAYGIWQING